MTDTASTSRAEPAPGLLLRAVRLERFSIGWMLIEAGVAVTAGIIAASLALTSFGFDVINVAGHRLSTGQMEEVLASHAAVAECAVIGVHDDTKGQVPRGFVVLKAGVGTSPDVVSGELVQLVRDRIGAVAALRRVDVVNALPKTRSGKILRKTMRGIADGREEPVPSTIEDPAVLDALRPVLGGD